MASEGSMRERDCASDACSMCVQCVACCCSCLFLLPLLAELAAISATDANFRGTFLQAQQQECRTAKRSRRENQMRQQEA